MAECPEAAKIAVLEERIKRAEKTIDFLCSAVITNVKTLEYNNGFGKGMEKGKRATDSSYYHRIQRLLTIVGGSVVFLVLLLVLYILAGAESTASFIKAIVKGLS